MKYAKKLLCLALALVMSLSLVACSSSGDGKDDGSSPSAGIDHDREVVYGSASLITNFNVKYVTSQNDLQALDQVYDTLLRKVNGQFCSQLADSWEISEDGLTYTFHINPDAKFSDGTDITAEDVEYSYEYVRDQCDNWSWLYQTTWRLWIQRLSYSTSPPQTLPVFLPCVTPSMAAYSPRLPWKSMAMITERPPRASFPPALM